MNSRNFFAELKRRNVYKVAVAYAVVAWLLIQAASILFPTFEAPSWVMKVFVCTILLGFPVALILAWAFELTPEGIKRADDVLPNESITHTTGRKLTVFTICAMATAIALLVLHIYRGASPANNAGLSPSTTKSIAVLPFANLSEDKANAYFADGIQDEILARLSKIADLKVISRTSTQKYKSTPENLSAIAKELGVANMLEGTVQKAADQVRITVQLIRADSDSHLWAETYDRKLTDIFGVETEVAQRIAASLEAKLTGREQHAIADAGTKNAEAYDAYLRALLFDHVLSNQGNDEGIKFYRKAVELDPDFALAWAKLANAESDKYFVYAHTPEQLERAEKAMETAVRLQPDSSETHHGVGSFYYYCKQDYERALAELELARQGAPNDPDIIQMIGLVNRRQGRLDESLSVQRQAANLDPRNPDIWNNLARTYRGMRRFKEAEENFNRALAISPGDPEVLIQQAELKTAQGDLAAAEHLLKGVEPEKTQAAGFGQYFPFLERRFDEAIAHLSDQLQHMDEADRFGLMRTRLLLAEAHLAAGHIAEGQIILQQTKQELLVNLAQRGRPPSGLLMRTYASLGEREALDKEVIALFEARSKDRWNQPPEQGAARAYAMIGDANRAIPLIETTFSLQYNLCLTPGLLRLDPVWDKIRNDPRFQKLCQEKK
jgi:TolB-like protein/cytochrome c-type biogenesis protein CcmH/NrfG